MRSPGGKASLVFLFLTALAACSFADAYRPGRSYFDLRRQVGLAGRAASSDFQELRGMLSGTAQREGGTIFIVNGEADSYCVAAGDPAPEIVQGNRVRMIVRGTADAWPELVAFTYEAEAADIERAAIEHEKKRTRPAERPAGRQRRNAVETSRSAAASDTAKVIAAYANAVRALNPRLSKSESDLLARCVLGFGVQYNVDPRLVVAVIWAESGFRPAATSPKGAMGLGQLMPGTAAGLGVNDPYDPVQNVEGSVRLIRGHLNKLSGGKKWNELTWKHLSLALASYNAGSGAVRKYGGVPPYRETRRYIERVTSFYQKLCGLE